MSTNDEKAEINSSQSLADAAVAAGFNQHNQHIRTSQGSQYSSLLLNQDNAHSLSLCESKTSGIDDVSEINYYESEDAEDYESPFKKCSGESEESLTF